MTLRQIIDNKIYTSNIFEIYTHDKCIINTVNPHSFIIAKKDKLFSEALLNSNILLPDGIGIVLASKILTGKKIKKIAGADIHHYLLTQAHLNKQRVFYLGASKRTLEMIRDRVFVEFPNILTDSYSPPYKSEFSVEDNNHMVSAVNAFRPDILFVGMTAPKQEKWVYANQDIVNAKVIASIGAVFDFYGGNLKRSGQFWIQLGLEWLPRLLREPQRLWRRNFISSPLFLLELFKEKLFTNSIPK